MRWRLVSLPVVLAAFLASSSPARADNVVTRAGSAFGGFVKRVGRIFFPRPLDPTLDAAVDSYAKGDYFTTYLYAAALKAKDDPRLSDEADVLMGVSAADGGLRESAVAAFRSLLVEPRVSPYYPLALAALLDLETRLGNTAGAADAAAKYLGDFWERPRSAHESDVKAVFLESGNISPLSHPRLEAVSHADRDVRFLDRPAERAMYLTGTSLLAAKEFDKAALCLESIEPKSAYFPYARYALGQAYYGLGRLDEAVEALSEVQPQPGKNTAGVYLRDRALLIGAELLHEADENSAAMNWVRHVRRAGPFGLHAALLAAEIHADQDKPALALVYLKDRPENPVEPKLAARAAAFDAELHRDMADMAVAVSRLEQGLKGLAAYTARLGSVSNRDEEAERLVKPLAARQESRERVMEWRRENIANAVPELLDGRPAPGWAARLVSRAIASDPRKDGYPIIYNRWPWDPFVALKPPKDLPFEPPSDGAFPTVFRRSLTQALNEALHQEHDLRRALESRDDTHLSLLLLSGAMELQSEGTSGAAKQDIGDLVEILELPDEVAARMAVAEAGRDEVLRALAVVKPLAKDRARHERLTAIGRRQLVEWKNHRRRLVAEAVGAEQKEVDELRFKLEFELSQTLADKKERENKALEGS
jgi:tetratricopeptide (TPR) repeat protein